MHVRAATPQDARAIAEVHVRAWQEGYRGIVADAVLDALAVADREQTWQGHLTDPENDIRTLVAEDDGGLVVGFVSVSGASRDADAAPGVAELPALYVDPTHWRRGVGRGLIATALAALRAAGADEVTLWLFQTDVRARGFFTASGFEPDGASRDHPLGAREVRLRRLLGSPR